LKIIIRSAKQYFGYESGRRIHKIKRERETERERINKFTSSKFHNRLKDHARSSPKMNSTLLEGFLFFLFYPSLKMKEAEKKKKKQIDPCTPPCTNLRGTGTSIMKQRKREMEDCR
jgi:hypothetical protein